VVGAKLGQDINLSEFPDNKEYIKALFVFLFMYNIKQSRTHVPVTCKLVVLEA